MAVTGPGLKEPMRVVTGQRLRANVGAAGDSRGRGADGLDRGRVRCPRATACPRRRGAKTIRERRDAGGRRSRRRPRAEPARARVARLTRPRPARRAPRRRGAAGGRARRRRLAVAGDARAVRRRRSRSAIRDGWRKDCDRLGAEDVVACSATSRASPAICRAPRRPTRPRVVASRRRRSSRSITSGWSPSNGATTTPGRRACSTATSGISRAVALAHEAAGRLLEARLKAGETGRGPRVRRRLPPPLSRRAPRRLGTPHGRSVIRARGEARSFTLLLAALVVISLGGPPPAAPRAGRRPAARRAVRGDRRRSARGAGRGRARRRWGSRSCGW